MYRVKGSFKGLSASKDLSRPFATAFTMDSNAAIIYSRVP